jgi:putative nucleotidyltransferase with HDIG domain
VPLNIAAARSLAALQLVPLGDRWAHTRSAAARAEEIATVVDPADRDLLICAAWLHDIGYAPRLHRVGFHPLDGAWHLRELGWPERLAALVAHHSCAHLIAAACGAGDGIAGFAFEQGAVADALVFADMTSGPDGGRLGLQQRLDDIDARHRDESEAVQQARAARRGALVAAVRRTEYRLQALRPTRRTA